MSKIAAVKGTRDFYPEQMAVRNWLFEQWRAASLRNGFEEYDAPIFEYLQLYTQKSGEEIASQLFSFTDRGGRDLAIRPEITPTLARMINQQINTLSRPMKWFSIPRLCRAERPQRGRLREFFQWNVDVIGSDAVLADAECIYTAVDFLRSVGLTDKDVVVKLSSRAMLAALLKAQGFADDQLDAVYVLLDKRAKMPAEAFEKMAHEQFPDSAQLHKLMQLQDVQTLDEVAQLCTSDQSQTSLAELRELLGLLEQMGIGAYCEFDITIVRGLAYYTGPVYEIFERSGGTGILPVTHGPDAHATGHGQDAHAMAAALGSGARQAHATGHGQDAHAMAADLGSGARQAHATGHGQDAHATRALAGGGRYDNLLAGLGGPSVPATGFGMGDVVLGILLEEKGLVPPCKQQLDAFIVCMDAQLTGRMVELTAALRQQGYAVNPSYKQTALAKQLKQPWAQQARYVLILGDETLTENKVTIKNMATGEQQTVSLEELQEKGLPEEKT